VAFTDQAISVGTNPRQRVVIQSRRTKGRSASDAPASIPLDRGVSLSAIDVAVGETSDKGVTMAEGDAEDSACDPQVGPGSRGSGNQRRPSSRSSSSSARRSQTQEASGTRKRKISQRRSPGCACLRRKGRDLRAQLRHELVERIARAVLTSLRGPEVSARRLLGEGLILVDPPVPHDVRLGGTVVPSADEGRKVKSCNDRKRIDFVTRRARRNAVGR